MTELDIKGLREKAEAATPGEWVISDEDIVADDPFGVVHSRGAYYPSALSNEDTAFIIAFQPRVVLAMLDEIDRCHARLEIDRVLRMVREDNEVLDIVPYSERKSIPDGIECRDATIKGLEERIAKAEGEAAKWRETCRDAVNEGMRHCGENARLRALLERSGEAMEPLRAFIEH